MNRPFFLAVRRRPARLELYLNLTWCFESISHSIATTEGRSLFFFPSAAREVGNGSE